MTGDRLKNVISALAQHQGRFEYHENSCSGRILGPTLELNSTEVAWLVDHGWTEGFANGGGFRISEEGHRAFMRSMDEMGDGELKSPK